MNTESTKNFWDERVETMPRAELESLQLAQLQEITAFAYKNSPYYKRAFDKAEVKPSSSTTSRSSGGGTELWR